MHDVPFRFLPQRQHLRARGPGAQRGTTRPRGRDVVGLFGLFGLFVLLMAAGTAQAQVGATGDYLQRMDTSGDGRVALVEYQDWMSYAFDRMDANADGVLQPEELPGGRGKALTREQYRQRIALTFARQDANGDGFLDARELASPPQ